MKCDRQDWTKLAFERNAELQAEQEAYEHAATMRQAQMHEQLALAGIELPVLPEDDEQKDVIRWAKNENIPVFFVPNGVHFGKTKKQRLAIWRWLMAMGYWEGMPDLGVLMARQNQGFIIPMLWIEMKRIKGGRLNPNQKNCHARLRALGHVVATAEGAQEAKTILRKYKALEPVAPWPAGIQSGIEA